MQSKRHSLFESVANVISGSMIAFSTTQLGSLIGLWSISPSKNLLLTIVLTFVSLGRSYLWRRVFNRGQKYIKLKKSDIVDLTKARNSLNKLIENYDK